MSVLVGKKAPEINAPAVMADGSINESFSLSDYQGKYVVLFFYPLDFTFVCPTELIAFSHRIDEFEKRDVQVLGCSIDSQFTHLAWRNTPVDNGVSNIRSAVTTMLSLTLPGLLYVDPFSLTAKGWFAIRW